MFVAQYGRMALAEYCDYKSINQSITNGLRATSTLSQKKELLHTYMTI